MGLGQARRRAKISHDPNNTAWSRSSTAYGQKILQSHGWTPGSVLGASDPSRSVPSSTASNPKIVLKDDNLGLGAKGGANSGDGQRTGLDVFQGILGRLNGHNEPFLEGQEKRSEDRVTGTYQKRCTKAVRFLSGGLLGETKQEQPIAEEDTIKPTSFSEGSLSKGDDCVQQVQTQVKCDDMTPNHTELSNPPEKKASRNSRARNDKKRHHKKESTMADSEPLDLQRTARREDEAEQKSKKRTKRDAEKAVLVKKRRKSLVDVPADFHQDNESSQISFTGPGSISQPSRPMGGRHAVRQRFIRQMKMATMDSKALNEVRQVLKMRKVNVPS
ncbi:telomerase inhibitor [Pseudocyphellaria aurata]|nr:telomerase inhibitor [Pseudocyphellaria aurata]